MCSNDLKRKCFSHFCMNEEINKNMLVTKMHFHLINVYVQVQVVTKIRLKKETKQYEYQSIQISYTAFKTVICKTSKDLK